MCDEVVKVERGELKTLVREAVAEKFEQIELKLWRRLAASIISVIVPAVGIVAALYFQTVAQVEDLIEKNSLIPHHELKKASKPFNSGFGAEDRVDDELGVEIRLRPNSDLLVSVSSNIVSVKAEKFPSSDINMVVAMEIFRDDGSEEPIAGATDTVSLQSSGFENPSMEEVLAFSYNWVFKASDLYTDKTDSVGAYKIRFKVVSNGTSGGVRLASGRQLVAQELLQRN